MGKDAPRMAAALATLTVALRKRLKQGDDDMFSNVLVGVDGRPGGHDAIALAKQLVEPGGHVTLVHFYGGDLMLGRGSAGALAAEREESEQLLTLERDDASLDAELMACASPSVGRGLHELAERQTADLLVVGSSRRTLLGRVFLGDDARASLNGAPCGVAIAPGGYADMPHGLTKVGVGYDGSPESNQALAAARALAARHGSTLHALSVVSLQSIHGEPIPADWPEVAKGLVDDELRRFDNVDDVDGDATYGEPSEELARFGEEVDLLIVGSRGYGTLGRLFNGSTSNYLARHARCPLLVLPRSSAADDQADGPAGRVNESLAVSS
jgi:nucleotide-binding universal stress UspA family protein